jgi:hypothetical protein
MVGISLRVVIIQDCIRDAASSEGSFDVDWNAVWQVIHLNVCLVVAAWGSGYSASLSWHLRQPTSLVSIKRPLHPW